MSGRTFTLDFKLDDCRQIANGTKRLTQACREYSISESVVCRWRNEFAERGEIAFTARPLGDVPASQALERRVAELERHCGQLSLENSLLKKLAATLPSNSDTK